MLDYKESWALKNWCFWPVVLEKTLESLQSNQSILKEISPGCSLEGLMVKLKLQYSGHLMRRTDSLQKTLMPGKIEGGRRRWRQKMRCWMASQNDGHEFEQVLEVGDGQGGLVCCDSWGPKESDTTERVNWTDLKSRFIQFTDLLDKPTHWV